MFKMIRRSNIKVYIFILVIIVLFVTFLLLHNKPFNYAINYNINNVLITEKYENEGNYYNFNVIYEDINIDIVSFDKYTNSRHLINDINIISSNGDVCLLFDSIISIFPVCHNSNGYYSYYIDKKATFKENDMYSNIKIDDLDNHSYYLWNYSEFIYLTNKKENEYAKIKIFNKDIYDLGLYYQYGNYLIIPDYNQEWMFDKIYIFNSNTPSWKEISLRFPIYYDSYFLGNDGDKVYIFDRKEEQEYILDIKKLDMYKTTYKVLNNDNWENISLQKLKNKEIEFSSNKIFDYYLDNDILYGSNNIKMSNRIIDTIVKVDNLDVYYISDGILYTFNPNTGEKALLKYSEWDFHFNNMVYIF